MNTPGTRIQITAWDDFTTATIYAVEPKRFYPYVVLLDGDQWTPGTPTLNLRPTEFKSL